MLAERWRVHYNNTIRPHSSLGYRSPAPEAWLTNNTGHGEVETAMRFPLPPHPDGGYLKSKQLRYTNSSNGTKDRALQFLESQCFGKSITQFPICMVRRLTAREKCGERKSASMYPACWWRFVLLALMRYAACLSFETPRLCKSHMGKQVSGTPL